MTQASASAGPSRPANLALIFQELFTAVERLRANRQNATDSESFRHNIREAVRTAAQEARDRAGYATEDIRMATLGIIGFLDETILNLRNPVFANWSGKPMQEELFGTHMAGEVFFQNLETLLARNDSDDLADVLEVYQLCLLLGYRGRYSLGDRGELQSVLQRTSDKIRRIRGGYAGLSPAWAPPAEAAKVTRDPWGRRLLIGAVACFALVVILFAAYAISLGSGASGLQTIVS
jgi:type VI secretion system protein ImpK